MRSVREVPTGASGTNTKWFILSKAKGLKLSTLVLLAGVIMTGYGSFCTVIVGKDKDKNTTGSSATVAAPKSVVSGAVFNQQSESNIAPLGGATVTAEWTTPTRAARPNDLLAGRVSKSAAANNKKETHTKSDGTYEITDIPLDSVITVTISSSDTIQSTEVLTATAAAVNSSAILKGRGKKIGLIKKNQETVLNTFDDDTLPRCQITVPANAVTSDVDDVYLTPVHQGENLPPIMDGYCFIAGADFSSVTATAFAAGKEATPYIILPAHIRAEELSSADIKLMEYINGAWVITTPGGKGKVHTTGNWAGYIGPHDTETPARLKGVRPWAWVKTQPTAATISGTIKDSAGNPIQGAFVFGGGLRTHTGANGAYTLRNISVIRDNTLIPVNVSAMGYQLSSQFVNCSPGSAVSNIDFVLEPIAAAQTAEVYGKVTNAADSATIYGAIVTLQTAPGIRGLRYDDKDTPTDLTDDTFYVIPPSGVAITRFKWMLTLPSGTKFTSALENGTGVVLNQLATEATNAGNTLNVGAYKVELEVTYTSGGKKALISGGFLLRQSGFISYIADIRLPVSLEDQLTLKAMTDLSGNYRFINLPIGEAFVASTKADGFIGSSPIGISALTAGQQKEQDFALSALTTDTQPPAQPTGLTGTAQSAYFIRLTWTAATDDIGIDYYRVYRNGTEVGKTTATAYLDSGLTAATVYTYIIGAFDKANNSALSSSVSVTTPGDVIDTTPPATPTNLAAIAVNPSQINLSWSDNAVNEDGYIIERSTDGSAFGYLMRPGTLMIMVYPPPPHTAANVTAYSDTIAISATTTYWYRIYARSNAGQVSGYSNVISATTPTTADITAPTVPTALTATAVSSGQINLAWTASTDTVGVIGYKLYRSTDGVSYTLVSTLLSVLSYSNSGLSASTTYWYKVAAYDNAGNTSGQSTAAGATTQAFIDTVVPASPANLGTSVVTATWIGLTWSPATDNVGVSGYKVFRNGVYIASILNTSYSNTGLTPSTPYTYTVQAYDAAGNLSALSAVLNTGTVADDIAPSVPAGLTATAVSQGQINLAWTASTDNIGVLGYYIYRNGVICSTLLTTSYSDTGLSANTLYTYTVSAVDAAGNISAQSGSVNATTPPTAGDDQPPTVPTGLTISQTSYTWIAINWTASTDVVGVAGYKVYRNGTFISTLFALSYSDTGLAPNTAYGYTVAAYDAVGNVSAQCAAVTGTTLADTTAPAVPAGLTGTAVSTTQINISWSASSDNIGVAGYRVYRNGALCSTLNALSYSDTGLTAGTQYAYTVAAYDAAGNPSAQSSAVNITTQSSGNALVAHWKFDEGTGTTANDSSGNGNNGTVYGATWTGGALSFDGTDDYVEVPNSSSLNITNQLTIELWFKTGTLNASQLCPMFVSKGGFEVGSGYELGYAPTQHGAAGAIDLVSSQSAIYSSAGAVKVNEWQHIVSVINGQTGKIYLNGVEILSAQIVSLQSNNNSLLIGKRNPSNNAACPINGQLDDIRIYNYARSAEQIEAEYNAVYKPIKTVSFGNLLNGVAFDPIYNKVYVASWPDGASWVYAVSATNYTLETTITSQNDNHGALAVSPDGRYIYTGNYYGGSVTRFDRNNSYAKTTLGLGSWANALKMSPDGSKLYVMLGNDGRAWIDDTGSKIAVVDTATFTLIEYINLPEATYGESWQLVVSPDGTKIYVTAGKSNGSVWTPWVHTISLATKTVIASRADGRSIGSSAKIAITPNGQFLYVSDTPNNRINILSTADLSLQYSISVGRGPDGIAVSPDGNTVLVGNTTDKTISQIDVSSRTVVKVIPAADMIGEIDITFNPTGNYAYAVNRGTPGSLLVLERSGWGLRYQTDFSYNPGWTTNNASNYYWDSGTGTYVVAMKDNSEEYATIPISYTGGSFKFEYDVKVTQMDWAADLDFGLYSLSRQGYYGSSANQFIKFCFNRGDLGYGINLQLSDSAGNQIRPSEYPTSSWSLNTWYRITVDFDASAGSIVANAVRISDSQVIKTFTATGISGFTNLAYLGFSKVGDIYAAGVTGAGYIDNVKFYTKGAILASAFNPATQDTVLATVNGKHHGEDMAQGTEVFNNRIFYYVYTDGSASPSKVYCYDPAAETNSVILSETSDSFRAIRAMKGNLYISHSNGKLWKYDGVTTTLVTGTPFTTTTYVNSMCEFNNKMYFGTRSGYIYESTDLSSFTLRATYSGDYSYDTITDLKVWNGYLYGCNYESYDYSARIFRSADGVNWSVMGTFSTYGFNGFVATPNYLYVASVEDASGASLAVRSSPDGINWTRSFYTTSEGKSASGSLAYFSQTGRAYFSTNWGGVTRLVPCYEGTAENRFVLAHAYSSVIEFAGKLYGIGANSGPGTSPTVLGLLGNYAGQ